MATPKFKGMAHPHTNLKRLDNLKSSFLIPENQSFFAAWKFSTKSFPGAYR